MPAKKQQFFHVLAKDQAIAFYAAVAVSLSLIDLGIPTPIPGIKPGIANIAILICMVRLGFKAALSVTFLRVLTTGLLVGTLFAPTFWLSLSGGIVSVFALKLCSLFPQKYLSVVSYSIVAAFAHMGTQIAMVSLWLIPFEAIYKMIPVFALFALLTGTINGLAALFILNRDEK